MNEINFTIGPDMKFKQLIILSKKYGIKNYNKLRKADLLQKVLEIDSRYRQPVKIRTGPLVPFSDIY